MSKRLSTLLIILVFFSFSLSSCNYFAARNEMKGAEQSLAQLKGVGGEKVVPYEYCSAESFLEISKMEFDQNDYKAAKGICNTLKICC